MQNEKHISFISHVTCEACIQALVLNLQLPVQLSPNALWSVCALVGFDLRPPRFGALSRGFTPLPLPLALHNQYTFLYVSPHHARSPGVRISCLTSSFPHIPAGPLDFRVKMPPCSLSMISFILISHTSHTHFILISYSFHTHFILISATSLLPHCSFTSVGVLNCV